MRKIISLTYRVISIYIAFITVILLLSHAGLFAQFSVESSIDSLRIEQKYHMLLNPDAEFIAPLNMLMMRSELYPAFEQLTYIYLTPLI